jgi:hypothetical protein
MKKALAVLAVLILFSSCDFLLGPDSPSGKGNVTISLENAGAERGALSPKLTSRFRYEFTFTGPGDPVTRTLKPGTSSLHLSLALGEWIIEAEAFDDEYDNKHNNSESIPIGKGEIVYTVTAGSNPVTIPMEIDLDYAGMVSWKEITSISFQGLNDVPWVPDSEGPDLITITVTVPDTTNFSNQLTLNIEHNGVSIDPPSGKTDTFFNEWNQPYTVTAADGSTQKYLIKVGKVSGPSDPAARIGFTGYDTLQLAIAEVPDNAETATTITLLKDITIGEEGELITISDTKKVKIISGSIEGLHISRGESIHSALITIGGGTDGSLELGGNGYSLRIDVDSSGTFPISSNGPQIDVKANGTLIMNDGVIVEKNNRSGGNGGGVTSNGNFIMKGGLITGNLAVKGGGVYVAGGTFTMSGNARVEPNNTVYLDNNLFITIGGDLSANEDYPAADIEYATNSISSGTMLLGGTVALVSSNYRKFLYNGAKGKIDINGKYISD